MLPDDVFREGVVETVPPFYGLPIPHVGVHTQDGPVHVNRIERVYPKGSTTLGMTTEYAIANTVERPNQALQLTITQNEVYAINIVNLLLWPSRNLNRWG